MCPHILRYLTTAVITNKDVRKRRQVLKDLVKVIQQVPGPQLLTQPNVHDDCSTWRCFFPSHRSPTPTRTPSQSLWSVSMLTLTLTVPRRSWGSVSRWEPLSTLAYPHQLSSDRPVWEPSFAGETSFFLLFFDCLSQFLLYCCSFGFLHPAATSAKRVFLTLVIMSFFKIQIKLQKIQFCEFV